MLLKTEWLESFVAFAERLSFTRAAEARHISQPALHVQIAKLGGELGVPLYRRDGQRLVLTTDGTKLLAFAREELERTRVFRDLLATGASREPVVLAAGEGAYLYLLGDALHDVLDAGGAPL